MKREFGTKLIEDFLAHQDLRLVADTSGAYIPGHGTPTVIIVGRNQRPVGSTVRAVLGVRGEPGPPEILQRASSGRQSSSMSMTPAGTTTGSPSPTSTGRCLPLTHGALPAAARSNCKRCLNARREAISVEIVCHRMHVPYQGWTTHAFVRPLQCRRRYQPA